MPRIRDLFVGEVTFLPEHDGWKYQGGGTEKSSNREGLDETPLPVFMLWFDLS